MTEAQVDEAARWTGGKLPSNVRLGPGTIITGDRWTEPQVFRKFKSRLDAALVIGAECRMDGVLFNLGEQARVTIGDRCHFEEVYLICEQEIVVGDRVIIGWRTTIVDSDFHPVDPSERRLDVIACSPLNGGIPRPRFESRTVVIEDDVWIGPNVTILKGTRIGPGAFIEPGAVVVRDVPARARVLGNPAEVIGEV
jgi:acetyltransferase-like isoleucine patch superfamily enzyme